MLFIRKIRTCSCRKRDNSYKLKENRFRLEIQKKNLYRDGTGTGCPDVDAPSWELSKAKLNEALSKQI